MPKPNGLKTVWLEAFVAIAANGTQEAAAAELGVKQTSVSRYVSALEGWLHKALLNPLVPGQLWPGADDFLVTAIDVLLELKDARGTSSVEFGQLRVEWLEAFVARVDYRKQAAAAAHLGVEQADISRHLTRLGEWLGKGVIDKKASNHLSPTGERFLPTARKVLRLLNDAKAPITASPPLERYGPPPPIRFIRISKGIDDA